MKRKLPPHIVLPDGRWRFVKKGSRVSNRKRKVRSMARRYRAKRRGGSRGYGGAKSMIAPIVAGVADAVINPRSPIDGIGSTAVGFLMHNETVKTIGLYQVGQSIAGFIPFIGGGNTGLGGQSQV